MTTMTSILRRLWSPFGSRRRSPSVDDLLHMSDIELDLARFQIDPLRICWHTMDAELYSGHTHFPCGRSTHGRICAHCLTRHVDMCPDCKSILLSGDL